MRQPVPRLTACVSLKEKKYNVANSNAATNKQTNKQTEKQ